MDRVSLRKLRLDRRLLTRRGWISKDELERELASLPDISDKVAPPQDVPPASQPSEASGTSLDEPPDSADSSSAPEASEV